MSEQVREWLTPYGARRVAVEKMILPPQAEEGRAPLLICSSENIEEMLELALDGEDSICSYVEKMTQAVEQSSAQQILRQIANDALVALGEDAGELGEALELETSYQAYIRQWDEGITMFDETMTIEEDRAREGSEPAWPDSAWIERHEEGELLLLDLPIADAWQAPFIVPMGGYNECPQPFEQAVLFRDWQRRFDAVPTAVAQDTWLLQVKRRPQTREEALHLAKEHVMFCQYVLESFETIGQYAEYLQQADRWEFWWD